MILLGIIPVVDYFTMCSVDDNDALPAFVCYSRSYNCVFFCCACVRVSRS